MEGERMLARCNVRYPCNTGELIWLLINRTLCHFITSLLSAVLFVSSSYQHRRGTTVGDQFGPAQACGEIIGADGIDLQLEEQIPMRQRSKLHSIWCRVLRVYMNHADETMSSKVQAVSRHVSKRKKGEKKLV